MENYREKYFRVGNNAEFNRLLADDPNFSPEVKKLMRKPETHEELMAGVRKIREAIRDRTRHVVMLKPHPRMAPLHEGGNGGLMRYITLAFADGRVMVLGKSHHKEALGAFPHKVAMRLLKKLINKYDPDALKGVFIKDAHPESYKKFRLEDFDEETLETAREELGFDDQALMRMIENPAHVSGGFMRLEGGGKMEIFGKSGSYSNNEMEREKTIEAIREILPNLMKDIITKQ